MSTHYLVNFIPLLGGQLCPEYPDYDPGEPAMKVMKMAKSINPTGQTKSRLNENIENLQEWINDSPERDEKKKIKEEILFISLQIENLQNLQNLQNQSDNISNVKTFISSCKPKLLKIRNEIGVLNDIYMNISSAVVQNAQNILVALVNAEIEKSNEEPNYSKSKFFSINFNTLYLKGTISNALDITFSLGLFDMYSELRSHYNKNLDALKSLARQLSISTLSPKETIENEIREAESVLKSILFRTFFKNELDAAKLEMNKIKQWQFLRSQSDRERQINEQQVRINLILKKGEQEKSIKVKAQQDKISNLKTKHKEISL